MDLLIRIRRNLDSAVDKVHLRPVARFVYRRLLALRYGADGLAVASQNDRVWKLHYEVILRGEFQEFDTILWLRNVVRPGDCVLDIGANVGQVALEAAVLAGPTGKVVTIEPGAGNVRLLRRHVEANGLTDRVQVVVAACGANHGTTATFHIVGDDPSAVGSGFTLKPRALVKYKTMTQSVGMVSVDGICRESGLSPAVIKIDVEGSELDVLQGAREVLQRCHPHLIFGFHPFGFADPTEATREIRELLDDCGYDTPEPNEMGTYELAEYEAIPRCLANGARIESR